MALRPVFSEQRAQRTQREAMRSSGIQKAGALRGRDPSSRVVPRQNPPPGRLGALRVLRGERFFIFEAVVGGQGPGVTLGGEGPGHERAFANGSSTGQTSRRRTVRCPNGTRARSDRGPGESGAGRSPPAAPRQGTAPPARSIDPTAFAFSVHGPAAGHPLYISPAAAGSNLGEGGVGGQGSGETMIREDGRGGSSGEGRRTGQMIIRAPAWRVPGE